MQAEVFFHVKLKNLAQWWVCLKSVLLSLNQTAHFKNFVVFQLKVVEIVSQVTLSQLQ